MHIEWMCGSVGMIGQNRSFACFTLFVVYPCKKVCGILPHKLTNLTACVGWASSLVPLGLEVVA